VWSKSDAALRVLVVAITRVLLAIEGPKRIRTSGERLLAGLILVELHRALFGDGARGRSRAS
jgi:hypothetical protein